MLLGNFLDQGHFRRRIHVKTIHANHGANTALFDRLNMGHQILTTFFQQLQIFRGISLIQRKTRLNRRPAAVHLQRPNSRHNHHRIRYQSRKTAFQVPKLLKTDIRPKATFGNQIITQLQPYPIRNDRTLTNGDVGKRPGMHKHRLTLQGLHQRRIQCFHHPGCHRTVNFQISRSYLIALFVVGNHNFTDPFPHISQIPGHRQNSHQLTGNRNLKARFHLETVHLAALADGNVTQRLGAKIYHPFHLHPIRINIQTFQIPLS